MSANLSSENQFLNKKNLTQTEKSVASSKKTINKWLSIIIPLLIGLFLTFYTYNQFSPEQIDQMKLHFVNANYNCVYLSLVIALLGNASRAYRWKYSLEHMGYTTSFANNFMALSIGYLVNMTIPKSGEISRAIIVKKYNDIPFDKGFGSIVAERIVDMAVLMLFIIIAFFLQFDIVKAFILDKIEINKLFTLLALSCILGGIAIGTLLYSKSKIIKKIKNKIYGLKEGIFSIIHMKHKWAYLFHTFFIWLSYVATFYIGIFVIPDTSSISFGAILTSFVVGSLAISFTNSGFGSYPFLIAKILLFYNIPETASSAFGWIVWTSQMFLVVFLGFISFLLLPILNRNK